MGCNGDKAARMGLGSPQAQVGAPWWSLRTLGICSRSPGLSQLLLAPPFLDTEIPWCLGIMVKHLPTVQETRARFQGQENPLKKGMATHSSVLASRSPWMEETGRDLTDRLSLFIKDTTKDGDSPGTSHCVQETVSV